MSYRKYVSYSYRFKEDFDSRVSYRKYVSYSYRFKEHFDSRVSYRKYLSYTYRFKKDIDSIYKLTRFTVIMIILVYIKKSITGYSTNTQTHIHVP